MDLIPLPPPQIRLLLFSLRNKYYRFCDTNNLPTQSSLQLPCSFDSCYLSVHLIFLQCWRSVHTHYEDKSSLQYFQDEWIRVSLRQSKANVVEKRQLCRTLSSVVATRFCILLAEAKFHSMFSSHNCHVHDFMTERFQVKPSEKAFSDDTHSSRQFIKFSDSSFQHLATFTPYKTVSSPWLMPHGNHLRQPIN